MPLYAAVVTGVLFALFHRWAYDDPFITYRYAENIANGVGFVYNTGEYVQSTTTPLFALLLALLSKLWNDLPALANLIGAASMAAGGLFLWDMFQSWRRSERSAAHPELVEGFNVQRLTVLLLYPTFTLVLRTFGSETPLYLALCLGAFAFYARGRLMLTALFSALAVLARPDGVLVPFLLAADFIIAQRPALSGARERLAKGSAANVCWSKTLLPIILFIAIVSAWAVFAWGSFGSPIPATLAAKQGQGMMSISQRFASGFVDLVKGYTARWFYWLEAALALLGLFWVLLRARRWLLFLAWPVIYFAVYSLLGVSRYYWYYAPLVPGFIALVAAGTTPIVERLTARPERRSRALAEGLNVQRLFAGVILSILFVAQCSGVLQTREYPDTRYALYRAAGEWLAAETSPKDAAGALEVGILGYYARRPMVDFAGLLQPEVAAQFHAENTYEDAALWAVENYRPRYLVLFPGLFPRLEQGYAAAHCLPVQAFTGADYGHAQDLVIYECNYSSLNRNR